HLFDAEKRSAFFDREFASKQFDLLKKGEISHLHPRDRIVLNILGDLPDGLRILDYGSGQGRLLAELLSRGYDAYGWEPSTSMGEIANEHFVKKGQNRLFVGPDSLLEDITREPYDVVLLMGITQYLSDEELQMVFDRARSYLKPGGTLICTFQNGLFDLFTFNKYTVDAVMNFLLGRLVPDDEQERLQSALGDLLTRSDAPPHSDWRARDNIFVRLSNPLTIENELQSFGFEIDRRWFYEWFGVPPLLKEQFPDVSERIKERFEVENAEDWRGNFMANAFIVKATPAR
ncbi:MAG: class I SAM-dependent methyltransferase, partial [Qipengyuania sp.]